jgi:uncharacterized protein
MEIEVACATPQKQRVVRLDLPPGSTVGQAVERSGLLREFPGIAPESCKLGVFGRPRKAGDLLQPGDRVEIYRPLIADPKQARRARARKA